MKGSLLTKREIEYAISHDGKKLNFGKEITLERLVEKARRTCFEDDYDYGGTIVKTSELFIEVICPRHGKFRVNKFAHMNGTGCPECWEERRRKGKYDKFSWFLQRARAKYGWKYAYEYFNFNGMEEPMDIECPKHGKIRQKPNIHLYSGGCRKCGNESNSRRFLMPKKEFIKRCKDVHGDKYGYDGLDYKGMNEPIYPTCPIHGKFKVLAGNHVYKAYGCPICGREKGDLARRVTQEEFIMRCKETHGNKYDYSNSVYELWNKPFEYVCHQVGKDGKEHGTITQLPSVHIGLKCGCPLCSSSNLEDEALESLSKRGITYERQKRFGWLGKLTLDFYLPSFNAAVECQGIQHYEPVKFFGGKSAFNERIELDRKKRELCDANGTKLLYYTKCRGFEFPDGTFFDMEDLISCLQDE